MDESGKQFDSRFENDNQKEKRIELYFFDEYNKSRLLMKVANQNINQGLIKHKRYAL